MSLAAGEVGVYRFEAVPFVTPDFDLDGDVDQEDFGQLQACLGEDGLIPSVPGCLNARLDGDSDVDQADLGVFVRCLSGPENPTYLGCAN